MSENMGMRELREAASLTQAEAAEKIGVHQSTISWWETGRVFPHFKRLRRIAEVYHCSVPDLLGIRAEAQNIAL